MASIFDRNSRNFMHISSKKLRITQIYDAYRSRPKPLF